MNWILTRRTQMRAPPDATLSSGSQSQIFRSLAHALTSGGPPPDEPNRDGFQAPRAWELVAIPPEQHKTLLRGRSPAEKPRNAHPEAARSVGLGRGLGLAREGICLPPNFIRGARREFEESCPGPVATTTAADEQWLDALQSQSSALPADPWAVPGSRGGGPQCVPVPDRWLPLSLLPSH